ncbi:DUF1329 domain-containing protein [Azoarcus sp. KH32C]|uniref:DUF1329 domain-containing protein n=1 Tax=Azoarcus sp. KH32C TaxID=748247 RepID=UPI0002386944|nr:DUF1329 domain-containing protein [Azoarcus sp. KH32C]BAL24279.1 hypothetical protein AZKH_1966 [Azoarcus sp. KH32C]
MKLSKSILFGLAAAVSANSALATVSADEARQLGSSLTPVGAEKAANGAGTIPAYSGTAIAAPASFKKDSGIRPDPFGDEKPRLVITSKNMAEHADKLTEGAKELLKRYNTFRMDVYPTHRTAVLPKQLQENTLKNAANAKAVEGGLAVENALPGVPFPIPKTGNEAMWNHLVRYQGTGMFAKYDSWNVDSAGVASLATSGEINYEWPIYSPAKINTVMKGDDPYWRVRAAYQAPARRAGESLMVVDSVSPLEQPRRAWQYLPGQRRVKLAPDIAYDTPNAATAGGSTYDDVSIFNGALDRFDFKLLGKREMYVPYSSYRLTYEPDMAKITTPKHLNPDLVRWELHRVWVVEATLKPGKRHIYAKRTFYIDEDSWFVVAADQFDARGELYRASFAYLGFGYDANIMNGDTQGFYDFVAGSYAINGLFGKGFLKFVDPLPANRWAPESLAGAGVR